MANKMTRKQAQKKIRKLASLGKIEFAKEIAEDDFRKGMLRDFCENILEINLDRAFISNKSEISDFSLDWVECVQKCHERYKVDLSGLSDRTVQAVVSQL